jgi:hypothetical protein
MRAWIGRLGEHVIGNSRVAKPRTGAFIAVLEPIGGVLGTGNLITSINQSQSFNVPRFWWFVFWGRRQARDRERRERKNNNKLLICVMKVYYSIYKPTY